MNLEEALAEHPHIAYSNCGHIAVRKSDMINVMTNRSQLFQYSVIGIAKRPEYNDIWFPVVVMTEEKQFELDELRRNAQFGKDIWNMINAVNDLDMDGKFHETPKDECLDSYILVYRRLSGTIEQLNGRIKQLESKIEQLESK